MQTINLTLAVVGLVIAIPSALTSWRDYRRGHPHPAYHLPGAPVGLAGRGVAPGRPTSGTWAPPTLDPDPVADTTELVSVSVPRRILSSVIDVYSTALICGFVAGMFGGGNIEVEDTIAGFLLLASPFVLAWINASTGRSLGKLVVGGRVVMVGGSELRRPGFGRSLWRLLLGSVLNILFVSMFAALARKDRRALHDLATATRVVRTR